MARVYLALGLMAALFFFFLGWLMSTPANAQMQIQQACGPRREIIDRIKSYYSESESWLGQSADGAVYLLMTSKEKSWTLLIVKPDVACAIGAGDGSTLLFGDPV